MIDVLNEFQLKENYEEVCEMMEGQTEWSNDTIEPKIIMVKIPFFYSGAKRSLKHILTPSAQYNHRFTLCRRIADLMRMEVRQNGKEGDFWVQCPRDDILTHCFFTAITADGTFKAKPELWGRFGMINDEEMRDLEDICKEQNGYYNIFNELVEIPIPSAVIFGKGEHLIHIGRRGCIRGFYYVVVNQSSVETGNSFDYSIGGRDPIIWTSLVRNETDKDWEKLPTIHHSKRLPESLQLRIPRRPGLHYCPLSNIGRMDQVDNSINYDEKVEFTISYDMRNSRGKIYIFLDMIRIARYRDGALQIFSHDDPSVK
jgi:hypothetical protein